MRSYIFRTLCLAAGVGALITACGGGEEEKTRTVLAVAFRLDEGTPVMAAYVGDPEEDPFLLPAGQYYIETLDEDDVVTSLGTIDVEAGEPVSFPSSVSEGGGTPDPEAAAPLLTIANFLIETDLAEYAYLEIVTADFAMSPFEPDVEVSDEDVVALFGEYLGLLAQKDSLLTALSDVEHRAQVLDTPQYVGTPRKPGRQGVERTREQIIAIFLGLEGADLPTGEELMDAYVKARQAEIALMEQTHWIIQWNKSHDAQIGKESGLELEKTPELVAKHKQWETYARELAGDIEDEASEQRARERLTDRIATDFEDWTKARGGDPEDPAIKDLADSIVDYFVREVMVGAIGPAAAAATESPTETPGEGGSPTGTPEPAAPAWVEPYVMMIAQQWLSQGYGSDDVAASANNLRACLLAAVEMGLDEGSAKALCPYEGFEPGTPTPESSEPPAEATPTPTPTPTPAPGPRTARGKFTFVAPGQTDTENTMTLVWNSTGGPITFGEGRRRTEWSAACGTEWSSFSRQYTGTYDPGSKTFSGTYSGTEAVHYWYLDTEGKCAEDNRSGIPDSGSWGAAWEDSVVRSTAGSDFTLTVEGQ